MGVMIFPGEKLKEYLPPRESKGEDLVAKFGAWLTSDGARYGAIVAYVALMTWGTIKFIMMLIQTFQEGFFAVIFGLIWLPFLGILGYHGIIFASQTVYTVIWILGWICYNKWTLLAFLTVVACCYAFSFVYHGGIDLRIPHLFSNVKWF